jgi:hypothetical protein
MPHIIAVIGSSYCKPTYHKKRLGRGKREERERGEKREEIIKREERRDN